MAVAEQLIASEPAVRTTPAASTGDASLGQSWFAVLSLLALVAFVLGVENRFTSAGLFVLPPPVDWIPPLADQDWSRAFAIHQQDPAFAACGGTETIAQYKLLYGWEWLRRASLLAFAAGAFLALCSAVAWPRCRGMLPRLVAAAAIAAAWWPARIAVELAIETNSAAASFNVGQYRHAVDVVFASAAAAVLLASAMAPRGAARAPDGGAWIWIAAIVLDIGFGALLAACNAAPVWSTWPGYEGHVLPPIAQLTSYAPWWLNLTFNPYGIQLAHRALSTALWVMALWQFGTALARRRPAAPAALRLGLISAQAAAGIATLMLGVPPALSIVHQVGGIVVLAAFLIFASSRSEPAGTMMRAVAPEGAAA
jgi:heme a synthase